MLMVYKHPQNNIQRSFPNWTFPKRTSHQKLPIEPVFKEHKGGTNSNRK